METTCSHSSMVDILQLHQGDLEAVRVRASLHYIEKDATLDSGHGYQKPGQKSGVTIIVAAANEIRNCGPCRAAVTSCFLLPEIWWAECCRNSNGYFGIEELTGSSGEELAGLTSWARFQVKNIWQDKDKKDILYDWDKLNVVSRWYKATSHMVVVILDPRNQDLKNSFTSAVLDPQPTPGELKNPFWIYPRLVEKVVELEETSVWATRRLIRDVEKKRAEQEKKKISVDPEYSWLHEISRHVTHVSETLKVGCVSLESIQRHHAEFLELHEKSPDGQISMSSRNIGNRLAFCHHMLKSSAYRAEANSARLQSEVTLAFNKVSQEDSNVSVQIAHYTRNDSAAMRTIAAVTMLFLPATFISAIFSTSFFNSEGGNWKVSGEFWIFWVVAIVVTVASFGSWWLAKPYLQPKAIDPTDRLYRAPTCERGSRDRVRRLFNTIRDKLRTHGHKPQAMPQANGTKHCEEMV
ncbi:hypothetical protein ED733_006785 [Metarhizium rileyi]|uniref:Mg2+ transporter protein, CorA-like/Zinc transport protein ZntB n=1 Tax=Metarhizium rileyi (strain RCEF 4871) TaxID=1649241 RepID=A0A5C6GGG3_METRR|nr:hypothetical protein ED733_006785 [Metarhizium rileyi]